MTVCNPAFLLYAITDYIASKLESFLWKARAHTLGLRYGCTINYVSQGPGGIDIQGDGVFKIAPSSHLKSNTFIECSGDVLIGEYFHVGRGLTIFSTNHNWRSREFIPYDHDSIAQQVTIGTAVWAGCNVTILPGSTIGDGAVLGAGAVIRGQIPPGSIVIGNPSKIIGTRDMESFRRLQSDSRFF